MSDRKISIRIGMEGGADVHRDIDEITRAGQDGFDRMAASWGKTGEAAERYKAQLAGVAAAAREAANADDVNRSWSAFLGINSQVTNSARESAAVFRQAKVETADWSAALSTTTSLAATLGAAFSVARVVEFGKGVFDSTAALVNQAAQAKVSVEGFQAYEHVLAQTGLGAEETAVMLARLTRTAGDAEAGSRPAIDAFNQLGISAASLAGGPESYLPAVADGLLKIQDSATRARLEVALFGRSGQQLESALKSLSDPTADLIEKQKALGVILGEDVAEGAHKAEAAMRTLWEQLRVGTAEGGYAVATGFTSAFDSIRQGAEGIVKDPTLAPFWSLLNFLGGNPSYSAEKNSAIGQLFSDATKPPALNLPGVPAIGADGGFIGGADAAAVAMNRSITAYYQQYGPLFAQSSDAAAKAKEELDKILNAYSTAGYGMLKVTDGPLAEAAAKAKEELDKILNAYSTAGIGMVQITEGPLAEAAAKAKEELAGILNKYSPAGVGQIDVTPSAVAAEARIIAETHAREEARAFDRTFGPMENGFYNFLKDVETSGKLSFGKLFNSILSGWEDMLNRMITEQTFQAIFGGAGLSGAGTGLGGLFSGIFGGGILSAGGPVVDYHSGGIVGEGTPKRAMPWSTFSTAPRYHFGIEEVPAVLLKGERVLDRQAARAYNSSSSPSKVEITVVVNISGARGSQEISDAVHQGVASGLNEYRQNGLTRDVIPIVHMSRKDPRFGG